jgi:hypothetical protein|uniref:DUF1642 domain-containing protein n=1 Tax=Siphoviridae sp. ctJhT5 TaxID=2826242 RepID=A0A8S5QZ96_9CAUD|nr:MAG TPA: Protein of unknown function (DUF1642) [Siphoviridae sp. ctJhT5]
MNKQELIEKYQQIYEVSNNTDFGLDPFSRGEDAGSSRCSFEIVEDLKKLDEPQKVKVPAYVAEWIERNKSGDVQLIIILKYFGQWYEMNENENLNDEICKWVIENSETFMRAWLDGYEVEEEPKYYLDLPKMGMVNEISNSQLCWTNCEGGITEKEIKAIDERYWPFAVPVEKV